MSVNECSQVLRSPLESGGVWWTLLESGGVAENEVTRYMRNDN